MRRAASIACLIMAAGLPALVRPAAAQIISPGKLIEGHAEWDAIDSCTRCHTLGSKGIDDARCLDCHEPIATRIEGGIGLHASFDEPTCASCHKDHFGRDFDPIRFDTLAFDHSKTGYELVKSHAEVTCSSCHVSVHVVDEGVLRFRAAHGSERPTFLGLTDECLACHSSDSPHGDQFEGVSCADCHDEGAWDEAPRFDHSEADFALDGAHLDVACESCHTAEPSGLVRYEPVAFAECVDCHVDPHEGRRTGTCVSCHSTASWSALSASFERSFDHTETGYELIGAHASAPCASCHRPDARDPDFHIRFVRAGGGYPSPASDACLDCHTDAHDGTITTLPYTESCLTCHDQAAWHPASFDATGHDGATGFALEGAHLAVVCTDCHTGASPTGQVTFDAAGTACVDCHETDSPHGDQFTGQACVDCHSSETWTSAAGQFDHASTGFELVGAHALATCASCHVPGDDGQAIFAGLTSLCIDCHSDDDPHAGQFDDRSCADCHDPVSFLVDSFDHASTGFPLEGVHDGLACSSCHVPDEDSGAVRFAGLGTACEDCHGD